MFYTNMLYDIYILKQGLMHALCSLSYKKP